MASPENLAGKTMAPDGAAGAPGRLALTQRRTEHAALVGVPIGAGAVVLLLGAARWPAYWAWIAPEQTPMTWLESVMLVLSAAAALSMAASVRMRGHGGMMPWLVLTAGFGYLALDERFALHERVRDGYLAPREVSAPFLPWVAPGDFVLLGYAVVGLALLPVVLRAFSGDLRARRVFLAGVVLAVLAVAGDSFDVQAMSTATEIRVQTAEEIVELGSATCFLLAMWLRLVPVLGPGHGGYVHGNAEPTRGPGVEVGETGG